MPEISASEPVYIIRFLNRWETKIGAVNVKHARNVERLSDSDAAACTRTEHGQSGRELTGTDIWRPGGQAAAATARRLLGQCQMHSQWESCHQLVCSVCNWHRVWSIYQMDQGGSSYPEGRSPIHEPGRRELPTQSYVRPLSWLGTNLSRQEPEEENLVPASSDEGLWQRSKHQK